ncbi:hypothetical protein [Clostridium tarantellae]|uniref:Uncharacterized protein n=1 Tax=Clostridium tarantellae TaxID=39493 RepID=A0A6I1MJ84_9CLOT|nr:hypothetical protein [Clostridium tarantellae]MPQ42994.1 hypothetical protein [Clostridium tarantellae]
MTNKIKSKEKKKWSKKKKLIVTISVIAVIVGWVIIKNVQARKEQQKIDSIQVTSVESMTPVQKESYDLTNKFGEFYFLDKNITSDKVTNLREIFTPEVQKELKINDENITTYVDNRKKINDEIKFIESINPKILTSNDNTVVLLVDLIADVVSSEKRTPGKYDANVLIAVENGKIAAFQLKSIKKIN